MWPDRVRNVGFALFENPVRSFIVGFLCWLLLLPLVVLLVISIRRDHADSAPSVIIFLSIVIGLSSFALRIGEALPAGPGQRFVPPAALAWAWPFSCWWHSSPGSASPSSPCCSSSPLGASVGSRFGRALPPHSA